MSLKSTTLGIVFALGLCSGALNAATVPYSFEVAVDSGPSSGSLLTGGLSYDDMNLTGVGEEYIALESFTFSFEGDNLTLADDLFAEAAFYDGVLLGISYNVTLPAYSVSFVPGFFAIDEAYFSYDLSSEGAGFGSLTITAVPTPAALPLLLSGIGAFGLIGQRHRRT